MLKIAEVQFYSWDKVYDFNIDNHKLVVGDYVMVNTELGSDVGKVVGIREDDENKYILVEDGEDLKEGEQGEKRFLRPILRHATSDDLEKINKNKELEPFLLEDGKKIVSRLGLSMKLIAANISFDDSRVTFAFIADGRVDFRDLVKEMNRHFHKSIRLQQLGARDEARITGDCGHCGRELCCKKSLKNIGGVSSDLPAIQQVGHRGSDRLSGACGRLMCCLRYENDTYVELAKNMPPIGSKIKTPEGEGVVIGWHTLKQTVDVKIGQDRGAIVELSIKK